MNITAGITIGDTDAVDRQNIFDLWALAALGTIQESDLDPDILPILSQTNEPTPAPGRMWFSKSEQVTKIYADELDATGVSVWYTVGPDKFEGVFLSTEPIPYGAAVQLTGVGRKVQLPPALDTLEAMSLNQLEQEHMKVIGFAQPGISSSRTTTASGTWFAVGLEGIMDLWYPANRQVGAWSSSVSIYDMLLISTSGVTAIAAQTVSSTALRGGLQFNSGHALAPGGNINNTGNMPMLVQSQTTQDALSSQWIEQVFTGARISRKA